jgi:hypothetical protein
MKSRKKKLLKKKNVTLSEVEMSPEERDFWKKRNLAIRRNLRRKKNFVTDY